MKQWNFKVKTNTTDISKKLESALSSVDGFGFKYKESKKWFISI